MTSTNETRPLAVRERRYPSDTTDAEWAVLEPLLPVPACELPTGGRPEKHPRRNVIDAIRYVNDNGCKWRAVPVDFGIPWRTVYGFFPAVAGERSAGPHPCRAAPAGPSPRRPQSPALSR